MPKITVKSTYSLDVNTVRQLESLAKWWNTSKSAAVRRAIQTVAHQTLPRENPDLDALDRLQNLLALGQEDAAAWERDIRLEREDGGAARRELSVGAIHKRKQLRREVQAGLADLEAGRVVDGAEAFEAIDQELGD